MFRNILFNSIHRSLLASFHPVRKQGGVHVSLLTRLHFINHDLSSFKMIVSRMVLEIVVAEKEKLKEKYQRQMIINKKL